MTKLEKLDPEKILETAERLEQRIVERFAEAGLRGVCAQLVELAGRARATSRWIARPNWAVRSLSIAVTSGIVITISIALYGAFMRWGTTPSGDWPDLVQASEAATEDILMLGAAIWFFVSFETRFKRGRILKALQQLRTLAHLIDVHQLTKNPELLGWEARATPSSPDRRLGPWEMGRYLDYCSEMLSLVAKIAALYSDGFNDADAVDAVTDLEDLCNALQGKIWQKIVLLETRSGSSRALGIGASSGA